MFHFRIHYTNIMAGRQGKILLAQFKKATAEPNEFIKFCMSDDLATWWILLSSFSGDKDEFVTGEYLCQMTAPEKFPFEPPKFTLLTPNGVYDINKTVCISIGEYHKDQYPAALGMSGFANQLVSGLIGWKSLGHGISIIKTTEAQKKIFAAKSRDYNVANHIDILTKIESAYDEYSKHWKK